MFPRRAPRPRSAHGDWYASMLPAMIPIALLGSAIYMGLQLVQTRLAREKYLDEANARIRALEIQVNTLQHQRSSPSPPTPTRPWWKWP
ncbi:hypothetical protein F5I97DRAFT_1926334 [Phlebopus sp. FC_14]|nr:hypothetical protein F5I97DRAFT_1926334 [Phlebopus sp. FC_14]